MKTLLAALGVIAVGVLASTAALVHYPSAPRAAVQAESRPAREHFAGSAETLSPTELQRARMRNKVEMAAWHKEQEDLQRAIDRRIEIARARPRSRRLPAGYRWAKCLMVVQGQTRISGSCAYNEEDGEVSIHGPRQIYGGIDYPEPGSMAEAASNDYWALLYKDEAGNWQGYGNKDVLAVHGDQPVFGPLRRKGACWKSRIAKICRWKSS